MTIAQQLNIKNFPFEIKDKNGKQIYYEESNGFWACCEYNSNHKLNSYKDSTGFWSKNEYDQNGNYIHYEDSTGFWINRECDSDGNTIYYEDSDKNIVDNRPKAELTLDEIAKKFGIPVDQLKIKK